MSRRRIPWEVRERGGILGGIKLLLAGVVVVYTVGAVVAAVRGAQGPDE